MAQITIDVPNGYADELGYQDVIPNPAYVAEVYDPVTLVLISPAVGDPTIPNPETKAQFLRRKVPRMVANALADKAVKVLERTRQQETIAQVEALRESITNSIIVP